MVNSAIQKRQQPSTKILQLDYSAPLIKDSYDLHAREATLKGILSQYVSAPKETCQYSWWNHSPAKGSRTAKMLQARESKSSTSRTWSFAKPQTRFARPCRTDKFTYADCRHHSLYNSADHWHEFCHIIWILEEWSLRGPVERLQESQLCVHQWLLWMIRIYIGLSFWISQLTWFPIYTVSSILAILGNMMPSESSF